MSDVVVTEVLPLRHVAARFIAKSEQDGLDELAKTTATVFGKNIAKHIAWFVAVILGAAVTCFAVIYAIVSAVVNPSTSVPVAVAAACGLACIVLIGSWQWRQYGWRIPFVPPIPLPAEYGDADETTAKNLDLLFAVLQRDRAQRPFFYTKSRAEMPIDRQQFFGRLRVLMLAEHKAVRDLVFSPTGLWFGHEIYIRADVAALIAAAKARPKAGGRPKIYDDAAILRTVIEHPRLRAIKPGDRGSEAHLMKLIRDACQAAASGNADIAVPEDTQLRELAKQILAAIEKNRTLEK